MPSPSDPVAFELFGIGVRWYAIFILSGIVAAIVLIRALARRRGFDPDLPLDLAPWVVFAGVAGARLTYVLLRADYFVANPLQAVNLRLGGLSIHGAIFAGGLVAWWGLRRRRQPVLAWADLLIAGVALGQAIGRWGNWANQEAFGEPTDLPWGLQIDPANRPAAFVDATTFHPTFLYESLFNLANATLLSWIAINVPHRAWLRPGEGLAVSAVTYGFARFAIESIRTDSLYLGPLPGAYWASIALILAGCALLAVNRRPPRDVVAPAD